MRRSPKPPSLKTTDKHYDVSVFLRDHTPGTSSELYRLADLSGAIRDETGAFIPATPYQAGFRMILAFP